MADKSRSAIWGDAVGATRLTTVNTLAGATAIEAQMAALSNASVVTWWEGDINTVAPTVVNAVYHGVQDAAVLSFQTGSGAIITLRLPAPQLTLFMADAITINPTAIASLIAACVGSLSDGAGNAAISYLGGFYERAGKTIRGG